MDRADFSSLATLDFLPRRLLLVGLSLSLAIPLSAGADEHRPDGNHPGANHPDEPEKAHSTGAQEDTDASPRSTSGVFTPSAMAASRSGRAFT